MMDYRQNRPARSGFTLVELLVVVAIIGILAAIIVPKIKQAIVTAKQGRTVARLNTYRSAVNMYFLDHAVEAGTSIMGQYPWDISQIATGCGDPSCAAKGIKHTYVPRDADGGWNALACEEVGLDYVAGSHQYGDQCTNWCNSTHGFCGIWNIRADGLPNRGLDNGSGRGGWNWCCPPNGGASNLPLSGSLWIDEDVKMFGNKMAYDY